LREIQNVSINDTNKVSQRGPTPYMDTLSISSRGSMASLPLDKATVISFQDQTDMKKAQSAAPEPPRLSSSSLVPELPWDLNYTNAYRTLRNSTYSFTSISPEDSSSKSKQIELSGAQLPSLWSDQADINLSFSDDKVAIVEITFTQAPTMPLILENFSKLLGNPVENKMEAQSGTSRLHWVRNEKPHDVLVTESQGTMKILITP